MSDDTSTPGSKPKQPHHTASSSANSPHQLDLDLGLPPQERPEVLEPVPIPDGFVGRSAGMLEAYDLIQQFGPLKLPVCVIGETGTGKRLVIDALHRLSGRRGELVTCNAARLEGEVSQGELFGYVKGAYTGAVSDNDGYFAQADGGTLVLEECDRMRPRIQEMLLLVLERGEVQRVGSASVQRVDVRLITTFKRDPFDLIGDGQLIEDFVHRVAVLPIALPPLRERGDDLLELVEHIRERKGLKPVTAAAVAQLRAYPWTGNVRQLEDCLDLAHAVSKGKLAIGPEHLRLRRVGRTQEQVSAGPRLDPALQNLIDTLGSKKAAAEKQGVHPNVLRPYALPPLGQRRRRRKH